MRMAAFVLESERSLFQADVQLPASLPTLKQLDSNNKKEHHLQDRVKSLHAPTTYTKKETR